jgi:hypothetical protein
MSIKDQTVPLSLMAVEIVAETKHIKKDKLN